jgi:phenylpyruvate tautomerase PptA (4-oxalocrotonate tautomerase family)
MPFAIIEVGHSWSDEQEVAIIDAVHNALVAAFKIPQNDKHVRLIEHKPHRFAAPPTLAHPELSTLVSIDCIAGRSLDAKRALYREIVERLEPIGIPRDHVSIVVRESPLDNWGIWGGQPASEVDLGFKVDV